MPAVEGHNNWATLGQRFERDDVACIGLQSEVWRSRQHRWLLSPISGHERWTRCGHLSDAHQEQDSQDHAQPATC